MSPKIADAVPRQEVGAQETVSPERAQEPRGGFWRELVRDVPALELIPDHPRPAQQPAPSNQRLGEPWLDDPALVEELARRAGTSLPVVALAAFQILLARASRQQDFALVVRVMAAGEEESSPLLLPTKLAGGPSFLAWLGQVEEAWRKAREHSPVDWEELGDLRALTPVAFAYQATSGPSDRSEDGSDQGAAGAESSDFASALALTLTVEDTAQGWILHLEYDAGLFDETTAHRWLTRYRTLLSTVCRHPEESVWRLPLLPEAEGRRLLAWNPGGGDMCWKTLRREPLHRGFEGWARRTPEAPAVTFRGPEGEYRTATYGELNARANRLAHRLRQLGVGPEVPVALLLERGVEMVTAILAVLKAGGAYVPLDPVYPPARLAFVVRDSGAALVLTQRSLAGLLSAETDAPAVPRLVWEELLPEVGRDPLPDTDPPPAASVDSLAYIIYTSGSTGQPKGVLIPHSHPVDLLAGTEKWFRFGAEDVWSLFHSFAFDVSVWELWGAFLYGARLVVAPYEVTRSPRDFHRLLRQERVTILSQTPSAFLALLRAEQEISAAGPELDPGWALRAVAFAGEALEVRALAPWVEAYGDAAPELINLYGITETTVHGTYRRLLREDVEAAAAGRDPGVGVMIPDQSLRILEPRLAAPPDPVAGLAPIGIPGELCVGGGRIARGYLGRPRLTAQRFVPDPFSEVPGARLYRSGDLARYREDGSLQYLGRIDHQIKLRGFRIEAGEVEAALLEHPAVSAAVVMVRTDSDSTAGQATRSSDESARLVAYLVVPESAPPSVAAEARELARRKLPEYMVPAAYVRLAELPLTANSKVDRRRLPAPGVADLVRGEAEPPRPGTEARLAAIWEEVLEVPGVGRRDHFLALGGHSLNATRVLARVRSRLGVAMSFSDLMAHPELSQQAARIDELGQAAGAAPRLEGPTTANDGGSAPLSYAQERMWLHQQLHPASNAFNLAFALDLEGELDVPRLATALGCIEERHQTLRTRFVEVDGSPRAEVGEPIRDSAALLPVIDLQTFHGESLIPELTAAAQARPFDLRRGRLLRCRLLRRGPRRHVLLLVVHHIACDGWSLGPFVQELSVLYGLDAGDGDLPELPLPELPLQYADFARWQRRWLESPAAAEQVAGWRAAGLTAAGPGERLQPDVRGRDAHPVLLISRRMDSALMDELEALARRRGTTLFTVLTAALYALLHRATGAPALTLGTLVAGRTQEAVENLVGCFINTLPLRCSVVPAESFEALLGRARGVAEAAYDRQDLPFEKLVQELGAAGTADGQALFQVLVAYQSMPLEELELPGLDWRLLETPAGQRSAAFDFVFFFRRQEDGLSLVLEVDGGRFTDATGEALAQDLTALLQAVARDETTAVAELPLPSGRFPQQAGTPPAGSGASPKPAGASSA
ncbi:MAG: amino acid adenylation domain-containing protein, partial [Acidobacteriota bacterium]|nr:amino acid adenylation domain-containing protein [Acidobacteriota bacterium]